MMVGSCPVGQRVGNVAIDPLLVGEASEQKENMQKTNQYSMSNWCIKHKQTNQSSCQIMMKIISNISCNWLEAEFLLKLLSTTVMNQLQLLLDIKKKYIYIYINIACAIQQQYTKHRRMSSLFKFCKLSDGEK